MQIEVLADAEAAARRAADIIAAEAKAAIEAHGRFNAALSGGSTPWKMLALLRGHVLEWPRVSLLQVDERIAPAGSEERNLTHMSKSLGPHHERIRAMPVEEADRQAGAHAYARTLSLLAGSPPVLDLVHLGLGPDGHTASLVPGDAVLEVEDRDVAITGLYQDRHRMTLTYATINRARRVLWLVTGASKVEMLSRLIEGDASIPAGRVSRENAVVIADREAAPE